VALALLPVAPRADLVRFPPDTLPPARGQQVALDFNPSQYVSQAESPSSLSFFLPARWRYDSRAVKHECTPAQAAAVACPRASWVGFGHVVSHVAGYLCPGGGTDAVAYLKFYAGPPTQPGDLGSMVAEVDLLSADTLINDLNMVAGTNLRSQYSVIGRVLAVNSAPYGLEVSFSGLPGGITMPTVPICPGLSSQVMRVKLLVGVVRRVKKPTVHTITVQTLDGPQTKQIHDHVLVGYNLFSRPFNCPPSGVWPWQLVIAARQGSQALFGTAQCKAIHPSRF
jgi:hypothetical protein